MAAALYATAGWSARHMPATPYDTFRPRASPCIVSVSGRNTGAAMAVAAVADREKTDSLLSYYDEHGYVVVRNLISKEPIANLLALYARDIVPSRQRFFRQNSSRYERNRINPQGYVCQSFLDIHDDRRFPEFSA